MITSKQDKVASTLVLGGSGRLGRMLRAFWPRQNDIVVQSRAGTSDLAAIDILTDTAQLIEIMQNKRTVICLSGLTPAHQSLHGGDISLNVDLALAAVRAAHQAGAGRVFLASSAAIYGAGGGPFSERDKPAPLSDYGRAKAQMEQEALELGRALGQPVTALRIGNVAGADAILGNWRKGMQLDTLPDGTTPRRAYIGPQGFARVLHALSQLDDVPPILNIASPGTVAMGDLLDAANLPWTGRDAPPNVIADVAFDTNTLEQLVDFSPQDSDPAQMVAQWEAMRENL